MWQGLDRLWSIFTRVKISRSSLPPAATACGESGMPSPLPAVATFATPIAACLATMVPRVTRRRNRGAVLPTKFACNTGCCPVRHADRHQPGDDPSQV